MSYNGGGGYIACSGGGGGNFRFSSEKENLVYPLSPSLHRNSKLIYDEQTSPTSCFSLSPKSRGSPVFGDEYSLFRSRSTSLSSSTESVRSTATVCESEVSERARSMRSTEPPSRVLSPLETTRDVTHKLIISCLNIGSRLKEFSGL